ncbi:hypothetical protein BKA81DRAFT_222098 [Phyllosticta paracitricarpa]|uniref:Uncharacterized protein n=1 Tax=Phyllosticta paracitricarpa TaxID=2016321 RepID=A0ABR1N710_9PEZI
MLRWAKIQGLPSSSMQSHRVSGERSAAQRGQLATDRLPVHPRHTRRRCTPEWTDRTGRDRTDRQAPARAASKPANLSATSATAFLMPGRPRHGKLPHAPAPYSVAHRTVASHSHRWQRSRARAASTRTTATTVNHQLTDGFKVPCENGNASQRLFHIQHVTFRLHACHTHTHVEGSSWLMSRERQVKSRRAARDGAGGLAHCASKRTSLALPPRLRVEVIRWWLVNFIEVWRWFWHRVGRWRR